jgi:hypothetical protein
MTAPHAPTVVPGLTDPLVRDMAARNHQPEEQWLPMVGRVLVICGMCRQAWPCATRQALDEPVEKPAP